MANKSTDSVLVHITRSSNNIRNCRVRLSSGKVILPDTGAAPEFDPDQNRGEATGEVRGNHGQWIVLDRVTTWRRFRHYIEWRR